MDANQMLAMFNQTQGIDLENRARLKSVRDAYDMALVNLPPVVQGVLEKHSEYAEQTGTQGLKPSGEALLNVLLSQAFGDKGVSELLKDPAVVHQKDHQYADGFGRMVAEMQGTALHQTLVSQALALRKQKGEKAASYADALGDAAEKLRGTLKYLKPIPNSFRDADTANNRLNHFLWEALQQANPSSQQPGTLPIPVSLMQDLALARYAGNRRQYELDKNDYLSKGWSVDPNFEDTIPDSPNDAPLNRRWMEYFYGDAMPPADLRRFNVQEEVRPSVRQGTYGLLDGYPVGAYDGPQTPPGLAVYQQQKAAEYAAKMQELSQKQQALDQKLSLPPPSQSQQPQPAQPKPASPKPQKPSGGSNAQQ